MTRYQQTGRYIVLNELAKEIHLTSVDHGFYDLAPNFGLAIALMHTELSEALEEWRNNHEPTEIYHNTSHQEIDIDTAVLSYGWKPEGIPIELADVIIRVLDTCAYYGIDIDHAIKLKMAHNKRRPYRNGGKKA